MPNLQSFRCFVIGEGSLTIQCIQLLQEQDHQILGVISPDSWVEEWSKEQNLPFIQPEKIWIDFLKQQPFDYLFSINNSSILSEEILALPQKFAVNYHDSPLPKYAGLFASSWALIHQEKQHAISWHIMKPGIDEGDILKQIPVDIALGETSLTLNAKCYETAIAAFKTLIYELATNTAIRTPQITTDRSYFSRTQKPHSGIQFQWQRSAEDLDALVRALNFGRYPNALGLPKIQLDSHSNLFAISELKILDTTSGLPPGTIVAITSNALHVATATSDVALRQVIDLQGKKQPITALVAEFNLQVGDRLPNLEPNLAQRIDQVDSSLAKHERFWMKQWQGAKGSTLSQKSDSVHSLPEYAVPEYAVHKQFVSAKVLKAVKQNGDRQLDDVLLAGFAAYLARLKDTYCFHIGLSNAKLTADYSGIERFFATQVPCQITLHPEQHFQQVIEQIMGQLQQIQRRKTHTTDLIARYPALSSAQVQPRFAIAVHQVEQWDQAIVLAHSTLAHSTLDPNLGQELTFVIPAQGEVCGWIYNQTLLNAEGMATLAAHFMAYLEDLLAQPDRYLSQILLPAAPQKMTAAERQQILGEWNDTAVDYPKHLRLHDLFEAQVQLMPEAIAVIFNEQSLTYQALNERANQLAHYLQKLGIQPEVPVGICIERSLEMIVGLMAIVKAGGAYVPLDPTYPQDRLTHILSDSQLAVILTQDKLLSLLPASLSPASRVSTVCLDTDWQTIALESVKNPVSAVTAQNLAYIIYTSGSTGKPKGVLIEHQGAVNTILDINRRFQVGVSDRLLAVCSLNFDLSVYDIFGLLGAGGTVIVPQPAIAPDLDHWMDLMTQYQVTVWNSAPPVMQMFSGHLVNRKVCLPASLKLVMLSGDWIPVTLPNLIRQLKVGQETVDIISLGGATEASIWSIFYAIEAIDSGWKSIPYGKPLANQQFYVLDECLNPVPAGEVGELYIGGDGVARGYLNRPDLNKAKFVADPFRPQRALPSQPRLYRTGDLGRYMPDGNIEFLGRIDHQVKIRGFRVEIGEIEVVLSQHPTIRETAILPQNDGMGSQRLVAYLVPHTGQLVTRQTDEVRSFLKEKLPEYMVPSAFIVLDALPLTPNGKLDRKALPAADLSSHVPKSSIAAPRNEIEQQLVQLWQEVLGIEAIGITDNFFELGGHSLVGVRLWSKVEKVFSLKLPLSTLFQAPTIEQLAERLRQPACPRRQGAGCSSLVVIQQGLATKLPLFCLHVLGRGMKFYRPMAKYLDPGQPIYGLSTHIAEEDFSSNQVEELAAHYVKQIKTIQPQGPYLLAGISFGGLVAFEVAQQLLAQGHQVDLLALMDTRLAGAFKPLPKSKRMAEHWSRFTDSGLSYVFEKMQESIAGRWDDCITSLRIASYKLGIKLCELTGRDLHEDWQDFLYEEQNLLSTQSYNPKPYYKTITLFRAAENHIGIRTVLEPELGWRDVAHGGLEIHDIPGNHLGMLQDPSAQVLGETLSLCISEAVKEVKRSPSSLAITSSEHQKEPTPQKEFQSSHRFA